MTILAHHPSAARVTELAQFDVLGNPKPQGSKRAFVIAGKNGAKARAIMTESDKNRGPASIWRDAVASKALEVAGAPSVFAPFDGPLGLTVVFRFAVPKARARLVLASPSGYIRRLIAPDSAKLIRSLEDGLQAGGLITDDARICCHYIEKVEVLGWTGAQILLTREELMP